MAPQRPLLAKFNIALAGRNPFLFLEGELGPGRQSVTSTLSESHRSSSGLSCACFIAFWSHLVDVTTSWMLPWTPLHFFEFPSVPRSTNASAAVRSGCILLFSGFPGGPKTLTARPCSLKRTVLNSPVASGVSSAAAPACPFHGGSLP